MKTTTFAVIGTGSFGYHVASALYEKKNEVIVIDRNKDHIQAIVPHADFIVDENDILIILGKESDMAKIRELE